MGVCRASQVADLFPTVSPEIVVREARLEDCWEVAETHCSSFFPEYSFPLDFVLRIDRLVAMLAGFSLPNGCKRTCLVAVIGNSIDETFLFGSEDFKIGGFDGKFSLNRRTSPAKKDWSCIRIKCCCPGEISTKSIAKRLIAKAEAQARSWDCRAIALHCDLNNPGAIKLYKGQGFRSIKVPEGANWPQPKTAPDVRFNFMMKLLNTKAAT
ncbi:Acyl-CoA N-acyltransferases superfamily protein [Prunus dulcis]|uniref:Acyl-CoA N-acyltransferases superfamily protein n=1 Tax=Prunus dulcis TaxID=3755 RepID=A0A4Y1R149_PRUDU|nr:Acyl-CoA N-acyltransferases superfamily protein [Prunus dulcis]